MAMSADLQVDVDGDIAMKDGDEASLGNEEQQGMSESEPQGLLQLPAELRNTIYELVLYSGKREQHSGLTTKFPAIVNINKQTRRECGPMFLGVTHFTVNVQRTRSPGDPRRYAAYQKVLDWLDWLGPEGVSLIGSLTIVLDECAFVECENCERNPDIALKHLWFAFIAQLARRQLKADQLRWPGFSEEQLADMTILLTEPEFDTAFSISLAQASFQRFVLIPALIEVGLFDHENPPTDLYEQAACLYDSFEHYDVEAALLRMGKDGLLDQWLCDSIAWGQEANFVCSYDWCCCRATSCIWRDGVGV